MAKQRDEHDYEAQDAMHTLMRADEIKGNGGLMKRVQKRAREHAHKSMETAHRAQMLARAGHISEKQMAKLKKNGKIASGKEGDTGSSTNMRGITAR